MPSRSIASSAARRATLGWPAAVAGQRKTPHFQSLVTDDEPVLVPIEKLDPVAALVPKDEDVPGQRVVVQVLPHLLRQPVEAAA
jgi:hypothetical protein